MGKGSLGFMKDFPFICPVRKGKRNALTVLAALRL